MSVFDRALRNSFNQPRKSSSSHSHSSSSSSSSSPVVVSYTASGMLAKNSDTLSPDVFAIVQEGVETAATAMAATATAAAAATAVAAASTDNTSALGTPSLSSASFSTKAATAAEQTGGGGGGGGRLQQQHTPQEQHTQLESCQLPLLQLLFRSSNPLAFTSKCRRWAWTEMKWERMGERPN